MEQLLQKGATDVRVAPIERLALVAEATPHSVILCDARGVIEWVNKGFTQLTGFSLEEAAGKTPGALLQCPVNTDPATVAFMRERVRKAEGFRLEVRNKGKDGRLYWLDLDVRPVFDAAGVHEGFVAIQADITQVKETHRQAKRHEAALRSAGRVARVGGWAVDFRGGKVLWSPELAEILGQPPREPFDLGQDFGAFEDGERERVIQALRASAASGERFDLVVQARKPSGEVIWARLMGEPEMQDGVCTELRGAFQDVTELRRVANEAAESERFAQNTLDAMDAHICVIDAHGVILAVNQAWRSFAERNGGDPDPIGVNYLEASRAANADSMEVVEGIVAVLEGRLERFSHVYPCHTADEENWFRLKVTRFGGDGPVHAVVAHHLITDLKRSEARLLELNKTLEAARDAAEVANEAKSQFLANMSHEVRTPLNGVLALLDLLMQRSLDPQSRAMVSVARESGGKLLRIVNDVLDYARCTRAAVELHPEDFDPASVFGAVVELFSAQASSRGLKLELQTEGGGLLHGDSGKLRQVVVNLVSNALKFAETGTVRVKVGSHAVGREDARLRIEVLDDGPGVPESLRERIFDRFQQADGSATRRHGGTGLGLAICREFMTAMGGEVWVENGPGGGATFIAEVVLPQAGRAAAPISTGEAA